MALKKGVHPRVEIMSFEQAKPFVDMGGSPLLHWLGYNAISMWCQQQGKGMRELLT